MSVHRRATSRGARYDVRLRSPDGRNYQRTFRSRREADAYEARELADRSRGAWIDPRLSATTFEDWAKCWRESASGRRPKTLVRADDALRLHLVPAFGSRPLGTLTPLDVQRLVNELAQRFAPATTRTYYAVLRAILNGAVNADLIARSPCRGIKLPRVAPKPRVIVGPDEIHRLADAIAPEYRAMVFVAGELGFRWGECAGLQVRDVDALRRTVTVRLNVGEVRGALDIGEPKTNAGRRTVAASAQLMATIAEHLRRRGLTARNADSWVFAAPAGGPLLYSHFRQRVWLPAVRKAELKELTFHGLRHAAATSCGGRGDRSAYRAAPSGARDPAARPGAVRARHERS